MEILAPVPGQGVLDVALLVRSGVLVDLDDADVRVVHVRLQPGRVDERSGVRVVDHPNLLQ